jgi:hypothetical protein
VGGIFISYRREDSAGHAGRLFDHLSEQFGKDRVFMDVAGIEPGVDFVESIDRAVGSCDVLIAVIGRKWLDCADSTGKRRLVAPVNDGVAQNLNAPGGHRLAIADCQGVAGKESSLLTKV